tara:strand:- start:679 stop:783 length:105 start_codon:yes stop_codon:yes gene_type:complete
MGEEKNGVEKPENPSISVEEKTKCKFNVLLFERV